MSLLPSASLRSAIPVDFGLFNMRELGPSTFVFFLFLGIVVDVLDGKAEGRIPDVVGSDEGGALLIGTAVLRPASSTSMPVTFTADV